MGPTEQRNSDASRTASVGSFDRKLQVITIPISDVDRAQEFYRRLGWRLDDGEYMVREQSGQELPT